MMELQAYEKRHIEKLRPLLPECTVLLRSNGDFPLDAPGKIALYGSGVRHTVKGGTGSGEVNSRYYDTVEQGFEKAGFLVTSQAWLAGYDRVCDEAMERYIVALNEKAKSMHTNVMMLALGASMPEPEYSLPLDAEGEVAVYVLARNSGEGGDRQGERGDILLTETEKRDILTLNRQYPKFLLALNTGGMVDLSELDEVKNILILSQLGVETGDVLARIVLGEANPSGRLTTTWQAWAKQPPMLEYGGYNDTHYREGIYVGYRYYDSVNDAVTFPFGYGLSFTSFEMTDRQVALDGSRVTVSAKITNTGKYAGKEVLQVYVSVPAGRLDQPYQTLAAWVKTPELAPGECREVSTDFDLTEIASYDSKKAAWVLEAGDYIVRAGRHSRDTEALAALNLSETVTVKKVKNALGNPSFTDFIPAEPRYTSAEATVISVDPSVFSTETVNYYPNYPIAGETALLQDEDLALLSNGAFVGNGLTSMIGNAAQSVSGAAGETAHVEGFRPIVMADGPAGLRLNREFFRDEKGKLCSMEPPFPQSMVPFMPKYLKWAMDKFMIRRPKDPSQVEHQYCTALPIGTAIAQSWNTAFAEICGDIVGEEMEMFNVDLWLAPALNIHRSIQCGRDFEYFSEDPLISGRFAAAITRGVQKHPHKGTTIKHFAANNQEFNRTSSNSAVSERALREIYLRGFEICIRESAPKAVMSSYNLINGEHTSTRRDLLGDILRCEFGFDGILMTDWVIQGGMIPKDAKYPGPDPGDVAMAGGDLFMPGSSGDYKKTLKALREGRLTRRQLQINASRLLAFWK